MTRIEILEFVKRNTTSSMATIEGGEPRVRSMSTPVVDENGLTFLTGTGKSVCRQLLENPAVELCYWSSEEKIQLRLRGRIEKLEDEEIRRDIVENRFVFLKPIVEKYGWESLTLFRLSGGEARLWTSDDPAGSDESFEF